MTFVRTTPAAPWTAAHLGAWLVDTGEALHTRDGRRVKVFEFRHEPDDAVLTPWATHFRNHYCADELLEELRAGTGRSREQYLNEYAFPDPATPPGPSVRAGDFAEILVADYLEYALGFQVPRLRYDSKAIRNESTKGSDVVGFRIFDVGRPARDILAIFEAKASLSKDGKRERLQDAVDDSAKGWPVRKGETLNAMKRRLISLGDRSAAAAIERFQNQADRPHRVLWGAAAILTTDVFDRETLSETDASGHPTSGTLLLIVIRGDDLMRLTHDLYARAASEA